MQRHEFDAVSFLAGLCFIATALLVLIGDVTLFDVGWAWLWPTVVVVIGVAGLASAIRRRRQG